jgi:hypothetical protein
MLNHEITARPDGAKGRIYLVQLGMRGSGSVDRHGGYEDVYVRTPEGWRISRARTCASGLVRADWQTPT